MHPYRLKSIAEWPTALICLRLGVSQTIGKHSKHKAFPKQTRKLVTLTLNLKYICSINYMYSVNFYKRVKYAKIKPKKMTGDEFKNKRKINIYARKMITKWLILFACTCTCTTTICNIFSTIFARHDYFVMLGLVKTR